MIDDRRDLVTRADFHELRRHLCLFPDVDRNDLVREPSFLEHHSGLVAVVRRPGVAIDHSFLPMKRLSEVCRIYPEFASARQFGAGNKIPARSSRGQRQDSGCGAPAHFLYKDMSEHKVTLKWERGGADFSYQNYPRDHTWTFDGGHTMTATAAPAYLG